MKLSKAQMTSIEKVRSLSAGEMGVSLTDGACRYLIRQISEDLNISKYFPDLAHKAHDFFSSVSPFELELDGPEVYSLFSKLYDKVEDADTYFSCLAALHKSRLKYFKILQNQPLPTMDQVGPRVLLQSGLMPDEILSPFLLWRKWIFDIDNRSGQETGYLFEPILAHAIGGVPASSKNSPIKRHDDDKKGRQVDCIRKKIAYEFKIRMTIAASGQGRWREELDFPIDCKASGFKPVLIVLDPTPNPKLKELSAQFQRCGGDIFIGQQAWDHLESVAGPTMSTFIEKYVKRPISNVLQYPQKGLPKISLELNEARFLYECKGIQYSIPRETNQLSDEEKILPDDIE